MLRERVSEVLAVELIVLQQIANHLREVRLARTEEPGHPHAHHVARRAATAQRLAYLRERVEHAPQLVLDLVGDDVLADFVGEG